MSRMIRHDAQRPALIQIGTSVIAICQCGLSKNKPFCDGSHAKTRDEEAGKMYVYDPEGHRIVLSDMFPQPPAEKIPHSRGG